MTDSPLQALSTARRLVRTLGSSPDPRRRAQEVLSVLKHADGWSPVAARRIRAADSWLQGRPSILDLDARLRALLGELQGR